MNRLTKFRSILITGGTGSFGKAFIKRILTDYPNFERVIVLSRDEFKHFQMQCSSDFFNNKKLRFFIGDVKDQQRLQRAFEDVDVVIHAAALKQVPSCEYNPFEAIKTNILGAQNVIEAALDRKVKLVIALSTDKACSPINLYGATKLCSDKLFLAANAYAKKFRTRFSIVRYGNVAGSRGSVIPFFKGLIDKGDTNLPITNFKMTRFWLTLDQAIDMVLKALNIMRGGELFVKKIPSMKIIDLAYAMAPNAKLYEIGIRSGEKIHETMIVNEDAQYTIDCKDFYIVHHQYLEKAFNNLYTSNMRVPSDFEYHSGKNSWWLSIKEMHTMLDSFFTQHKSHNSFLTQPTQLTF